MRARAQTASVVRTAAVTLPTRADGSVCLGVVADTHSRPHPATVELLRALSPDAILHGGDIGDLGVLETLAAVAPVHAVRGNIDVRAPNLPDELTIVSLPIVFGTLALGESGLRLEHVSCVITPGEAMRAGRVYGGGLVQSVPDGQSENPDASAAGVRSTWVRILCDGVDPSDFAVLS